MTRRDPSIPAACQADLALDVDRLDQHLLANPAAVRALVDAAQLTPDNVVEDVGAGTGLVTRELARRGPAAIHAVEIDPKFRPYLTALARAHRTVTVRWADIRTTGLSDATKVVANPPFRLTEQLLHRLHRLPCLVAASLVMGYAFGRGATAEPGSADYTRQSLRVQSGFVASRVARLSPNDFFPPVRRAGWVVRLAARRPSASVEPTVDDAFTYRAGIRGKDLLWYLEHRAPWPESPAERHRNVAELRATSVVRELSQLRLQQVSDPCLSRFMAEVRRIWTSPH